MKSKTIINMKRIVLILIFSVITHVLFAQSSKYYFNRGLEWAGSANKIHWQTQAFKEWQKGEQKGEVDCARALIICYIEEKGTPRNIKAALNLINKWYKKDQKICVLGALLNIPKKYGFVPLGINLGYYANLSLGRLEDISLDDYGLTANISQALFYAKYAKEHHKDATTYTSKTDLFYIIEGLCYEHGVGGYKKNLIQAAKRFNYVIDRYGDHYYGPMRELINTSASLNELYLNMSETSQDIASSPSHNMEYLVSLAATKGSAKPIRDGYINDFLFKVDKFVESFWKLPKQEREAQYSSSSEDVKKIYDKSKQFNDVDSMPEYPGGQAALVSFLSSNINYPESAAENGVEGRVVVRFFVAEDGSIIEPQVVQSVDPALDKEAIRIVLAMPKWKPGEKDGHPVCVDYMIPINFRLQ